VKTLGPQGMMLVQAYMLTPALAAIFTRAFFYEPKFKDAQLRFGKWRDYLRFWLVGLGIAALSYLLFTLLGGFLVLCLVYRVQFMGGSFALVT
jgi:hypothetical protein